jgi:hypothetical protein
MVTDGMTTRSLVQMYHRVQAACFLHLQRGVYEGTTSRTAVQRKSTDEERRRPFICVEAIGFAIADGTKLHSVN